MLEHKARYRVQKATRLHRNYCGLCLESLHLRLTKKKSNRLAKEKQEVLINPKIRQLKVEKGHCTTVDTFSVCQSTRSMLLFSEH